MTEQVFASELPLVDSGDARQIDEQVDPLDDDYDPKPVKPRKKRGRPSKGTTTPVKKSKCPVPLSTPPSTKKKRRKRRKTNDAASSDEDATVVSTPVEPIGRNRPKRERKPTRRASDLKELEALLGADDFSEDSGSDASFLSEDNPAKEWCVCRQPWDARFMISCDSCEKWFHGSCMNLTKTQGKAIEKSGETWFCPKCKPTKQRIDPNIENDDHVRLCIVCMTKPCKEDSVFCSDVCIMAHVDETVAENALPIKSVDTVVTLEDDDDFVVPSKRASANKKASSVQRLVDSMRKTSQPTTQRKHPASRSAPPTDRPSPSPPQTPNDILFQIATAIPDHIILESEWFSTTDRYYMATLNELLMFIYEGRVGGIPIRYKPPHVTDICGGMFYVYKTYVYKRKDGTSTNFVHWTKDGFVFNHQFTKKYPILQTDGEIFEQLHVTPPENPGDDPNETFRRRAVWTSFDPDLVVVQYIGDETQGVIRGVASSPDIPDNIAEGRNESPSDQPVHPIEEVNLSSPEVSVTQPDPKARIQLPSSISIVSKPMRRRPATMKKLPVASPLLQSLPKSTNIIPMVSPKKTPTKPQQHSMAPKAAEVLDIASDEDEVQQPPAPRLLALPPGISVCRSVEHSPEGRTSSPAKRSTPQKVVSSESSRSAARKRPVHDDAMVETVANNVRKMAKTLPGGQKVFAIQTGVMRSLTLEQRKPDHVTKEVVDLVDDDDDGPMDNATADNQKSLVSVDNQNVPSRMVSLSQRPRSQSPLLNKHSVTPSRGRSLPPAGQASQVMTSQAGTPTRSSTPNKNPASERCSTPAKQSGPALSAIPSNRSSSPSGSMVFPSLSSMRPCTPQKSSVLPSTPQGSPLNTPRRGSLDPCTPQKTPVTPKCTPQKTPVTPNQSSPISSEPSTPGSGRKKRPKIAPRRSLSHVLKQSQYKQHLDEIKSRAHNNAKEHPAKQEVKVEETLPDPDSTTELKESDDEIQIISEELSASPVTKSKKLVQVQVDESELAALRSLGFSVIKNEPKK